MITVNGHQIKPTLFPDGTSQVWKLPDEIMTRRHVFVTWNFSHEAEFMHLAQLKDLLDCSGINANLDIGYLPYGRQDKQVNNDNTFALRTFANLLNSLNFYKVMCLDPHSAVAKELIKHFISVPPTLYFESVCKLVKPDVICYPDKGAREKYSDLFDIESIHCEKQRDQSTGEITSLTLTGDAKDRKVLIFDDICDGGATFIRIAKLINPLAKDINLFVTHGVFSKGVIVLRKAGIKRIFTKDGEVFEYDSEICYTPYFELEKNI